MVFAMLSPQEGKEKRADGHRGGDGGPRPQTQEEMGPPVPVSTKSPQRAPDITPGYTAQAQGPDSL